MCGNADAKRRAEALRWVSLMFCLQKASTHPVQSFNNSLEFALLWGLREPAHVPRDGHGGAPIRHCQLLLDVLGHIHQNRPWAASPSEVERLLDHSALQTMGSGLGAKAGQSLPEVRLYA